jgi:DNA polymerase-3 subunit epsilon
VRLSECSYVVVDCETTGFHPSAHHRIVELALVHVGPGDADLEPWATLLRPDRDLGPTEVHRLRGRDLVDAPSFDEVLGEVLDRLAGRVVVAHNARFDCAFLEHELRRAGVDVAPLPGLCTMELAGLLGVAGGRLRLEDCCRAVGIDHEPSHTAAGDALACARLLFRFLPMLTGGAVGDLAALGCPEPRPPWTWPRDERRAACKQRSERSGPRKEPTFLGRLVEAADAPIGTDATQIAPYVDILERALEDRRLSPLSRRT